MGSFLGKVVRVGLNAVTPKHSLRWASPTNKGLSKFINGTQKMLVMELLDFNMAWNIK